MASFGLHLAHEPPIWTCKIWLVPLFSMWPTLVMDNKSLLSFFFKLLILLNFGENTRQMFGSWTNRARHGGSVVGAFASQHEQGKSSCDVEWLLVPEKYFIDNLKSTSTFYPLGGAIALETSTVGSSVRSAVCADWVIRVWKDWWVFSSLLRQ